jgi:Yip1 domain
MIKAFLLLFEPVQSWEKVARAQRSIGMIIVTFLLPMILLSAAAEGYGLAHWGKERVGAEFQSLRKMPLAEAVVYEFAQGLLSIAVVLIAAKILKSLGETFHGRHSYRQAITTIAYGLSPLFVLRCFDAFPSVSPWTTWSLGAMLCVAVLYHGLPRVMMPDPAHAFGLFLMNSLLVVLITGLARFVTAWYLSGHFKPVEQVIAVIAGWLPF